MRSDVAFAIEQFQMTERRACKLLEVDRSSYRYEPRRDHNAELRQWLIQLARQKPLCSGIIRVKLLLSEAIVVM